MHETRPNSRASKRRPKVVIDTESMNRLEALADGAFRRNPALADRLLDELGRARTVPLSKLPPNVVAIGRALIYRDESTGQEKTIVPVFPEEADIARGRIVSASPAAYAARLDAVRDFQGMSSSIRLLGWPSRSARRV